METAEVEQLPAKSEKANASDPKSKEQTPKPEEIGMQRKLYELAVEQLNSTATKLAVIATSKHDSEMVRYASRVFERRHITIEVHAAPINPAAASGPPRPRGRAARQLHRPLGTVRFRAQPPARRLCRGAHHAIRRGFGPWRCVTPLLTCCDALIRPDDGHGGEG